MVNDTGYFSECANHINVEDHFDDCVFDMCATEGDKDTLLEDLEAFVSDCKKMGISLCDWRMVFNLPMLRCPEHSLYKGCTSACPNSCANINATESCHLETVEGCECEEGYVLEGKHCVLVEDCQVPDEKGIYYAPGPDMSSIFAPITSTITTIGATSFSPPIATSTPQGLVSSTEGTESTTTEPEKLATCTMSGDPHYTMFNESARYDFQGLCTYVASETHLMNLSDPRWFTIHVENEMLNGNPKVSYVKNARILLDGGNTDIFLDKDQEAMINGRMVLEANTANFSLKQSGGKFVVTTKYGVEVSYVSSFLMIRLPPTYSSQVRGLCGDYNGNRSDDLMMKNGSLAREYNQFGASYQVGECEMPDIPDPVHCSDEEREKWSVYEYCGSMVNTTGYFSECANLINVEEHFEDCLFDMCATGGDNKILLLDLEAFVSDCKRMRLTLCDWRAVLNQPMMQCPDNSSYNGCATACPDTCASREASRNCALPTVEACVCDLGYVFEGSECVTAEQCRKADEKGIYYARECLRPSDIERGSMEPVKQYFNPNEVITYKCHEGYRLIGDAVRACHDGNWSMPEPRCQVQCARPIDIEFGSLSPSQEYYDINNVITYSCDEGYSVFGESQRSCHDNGSWSGIEPICKVQCKSPNNVPNGRILAPKELYDYNEAVAYECYDGFSLVGDAQVHCGEEGRWTESLPKCKELVECRISGDPHYSMFQESSDFEFQGLCVYVASETYKLNASDPRWFSIHVENEMRSGNTKVSFLKNIRIHLDGGNTDIRLYKSKVATVNGRAVLEVLTDTFSLRISGSKLIVTTQYGVQISFTHSAVLVKMPPLYMSQIRGLCGDYNGNKSDDLLMQNGEMAKDFNEFGASYQVGECSDPSIPEGVVCSRQERVKWSAYEFCGSMIDSNGYFSQCKAHINTEAHFEDCVFDMCATDGDEQILLEDLETFVIDCKESGVPLCDWRNALGKTMLNCPAHSTYNGCSPACSRTCGNLHMGSKGCGPHTVEACVCDDGYVLEGNRCIRPEDCGPVVNGFYYVVETYSVRLAGGRTSGEGRVELYREGEWGTICDDGWELEDAIVVCRALGFTTAVSAPILAHFGVGKGQVWLDDINCKGSEASIGECAHAGWKTHNCDHLEDSSVVCASEPKDYQVRLSGGETKNKGRVEIFHDGQWGTVCNDGWDLYAATVVCQELGFISASSPVSVFEPGDVSASVWIEKIDCRGNETFLAQCTHSSWESSNCTHENAASVECSTNSLSGIDVRLVNGSSLNEGRVEVYREETWGTICDDEWDENDAKVICGLLGYEGPSKALSGAHFGEGSGPVLFSIMECSGNEIVLQACPRDSSPNCEHSRDASVVCTHKTKDMTDAYSAPEVTTELATLMPDVTTDKETFWNTTSYDYGDYGEYTTSSDCPNSREPFDSVPEWRDTTCVSVCENVQDGNVRSLAVGFSLSGLPAVLKIVEDSERGYQAYCDCTEGPELAWTTIMRSHKESVKEYFTREECDYRYGFGNLTEQFWIGLQPLYLITLDAEYSMRMEFTDIIGNKGVIEYRNFNVVKVNSGFSLNISGYSGSSTFARLTQDLSGQYFVDGKFPTQWLIYMSFSDLEMKIREKTDSFN